MFTKLAIHSTRIAMVAATAPRKTALIRKSRKMVALPLRIMRVYPEPSLTTLADPPMMWSKFGAKK